MKSKIAALVAASLFTTQAWAVATITLQGNYVKIGTSEYGTIGSKSNTPPGMLYDNTGTGTFNAAYDYLTPGSPFEGWTVKFTNTDTGASVSNTNNNTGAQAVTGGILTDYRGVAYNGTTYDQRAVWTGSTVNYDLLHDVHFNNGQKYIDITTVLTAKVNMTNLYFGRFMDPDARAAAGDSSATNNTLGYSLTDGTVVLTNKQVVMSEALASKYALGLYTAASNAGAGISSSWTTDPVNYYNNVNNGNGDYTIGLGFKVDSLASGSTATFNYAYIFGPTRLAANETAVSSGAGGGTAGVIPGCTAPCTVAGFDTGSGSSGPSVTGTRTDYVDARTSTVYDTAHAVTTVGIVLATSQATSSAVDTFARGAETKVLAVTKTVTTTTLTPRTTTYTTTTDYNTYAYAKPQVVTLYSDGTESAAAAGAEVLRSTTPGVDVATLVINDTRTDVAAVDTNYSTRIDQFDQLKNLNARLNVRLDSNPLDRHHVEMGAIRSHIDNDRDNWTYIVAEGSNSSTVDAYKTKTNRFGFGYERRLDWNWLAGIQYNYVNSDLSGDQAGGKLEKNHLGVYHLYTLQDWILKTDAGVAYDQYRNNHSINELAFTNSGKANGYSLWINQRAYTPNLYGFRPYVGVRLERAVRDAVTESGSEVTAMTYSKYNKTQASAEAGVRYEKNLFYKVNLVAEAGRTTENITTGKLGLNLLVDNNLTGGINVTRQRQLGIDDTTVMASLKWAF